MNEEIFSVFFGYVDSTNLEPLKRYFLKFSELICKTLLIVCLGILFSVFFGSCKTCKCPAYSQFELHTPAKVCVILI